MHPSSKYCQCQYEPTTAVPQAPISENFPSSTSWMDTGRCSTYIQNSTVQLHTDITNFMPVMKYRVALVGGELHETFIRDAG